MNKPDCKWCGFSYADAKPGREYLYHDEQACEVANLRKVRAAALTFVAAYEASQAGACDMDGEAYEHLRSLVAPDHDEPS